MKIRWLKKALRNLEQTHEYISRDNPEAGARIVTRIQNAASQLADYPLMGRVGRVEGTRELVISQTPYILIYRVKGNAVEILRVIHSAMRYPDR
ncbi:MAG: type II toxin-antitoxin system RelE/ParE family toxin [Hormoscilla sp. GM102CHS1]|nr:type II toxin-antitoxin system RelE/ParE family toxin [Hormoscilla sp. GM102CHS1]MBC6480888.1 type II toxin-antitoxin system RelE/ParE family toxin [Hormoscilla sp. GM7CHS1pb]